MFLAHPCGSKAQLQVTSVPGGLWQMSALQPRADVCRPGHRHDSNLGSAHGRLEDPRQPLAFPGPSGLCRVFHKGQREVKDGILGATVREETQGMDTGLMRGPGLPGRAAPSSLPKHLLRVCVQLSLWVITKHEEEVSLPRQQHARQPLGTGRICI